MRSLLGLLAGCGILMLVACSRTEPPGSGGPVAAITSAGEMDTRSPVEESSDEAAAVEPEMEGNTGLAAGQRAPSFLLEDQAGAERSLDEFSKGGKVALVFYRSADW